MISPAQQSLSVLTHQSWSHPSACSFLLLSSNRLENIVQHIFIYNPNQNTISADSDIQSLSSSFSNHSDSWANNLNRCVYSVVTHSYNTFYSGYFLSPILWISTRKQPERCKRKASLISPSAWDDCGFASASWQKKDQSTVIDTSVSFVWALTLVALMHEAFRDWKFQITQEPRQRSGLSGKATTKPMVHLSVYARDTWNWVTGLPVVSTGEGV